MKITRREMVMQGTIAAALLKSSEMWAQERSTAESGSEKSDASSQQLKAPSVDADESNKMNGDMVVAVDKFGRVFNTITSYKPNRKVGLFFWLWIGQPYASGIYDASTIMTLPRGIERLYDFDRQDSAISPSGQAHFWGEPIWGHYNSDDEWVIRRQMRMLTLAGVDFIVFDATNYVTYKAVYMKLLSVLSEYIEQGWATPKVAFYTHSRSTYTTKQLYSELYGPGLFPETWFRVDGKPMIIAYTNLADDLAEARTRGDLSYSPTQLPQSIVEFFHFKKPQWPSDPAFANGFPWIEWSYPQPLHGNMMNVTVASHPNIPMSRSITDHAVNWGRGWDPEQQMNIVSNADRGTFFQLQWEHALKSDPEIVFVGGWNEWIAYKQPWQGEYMLCDAASKEFSRDCEPMKGGYEDSFYLQLTQNIRRYKGNPGGRSGGKKKTIDIVGPASQWHDVTAIYRQVGKDYERNAYGAAKTVSYRQSAPTNDIQEIRIVHDNENVYFYIRCQSRIVEQHGAENWMNLFIGIGDPKRRGWEGYDFVIGRKYSDRGASIERLGEDGSSISDRGTATYRVHNNLLQLSIPQKAIWLDLRAGKFYLKIADGVDDPRDIMDYYVSGSVVPLGRLSYMYTM